MSRLFALLIALFALHCCAALAVPKAEVTMADGKDYKLVTHERRTFGLSYEKNMESFAKADAADLRRGGIVCTGSSSMVGWKTVQRDLAPLPVVNRAFGGSTSIQLWWYADRAVLPRQPRLVVVYIGDNDLVNDKVTVGNYMKYVRLFRDEVWAQSPKTRIAFLSSKPSPSRWHCWAKFQEANRRLARMCSRDPRLTYIDITPTLLDAQGQVIPDLFLPDRLHIKPETYARWTAVVKPVLSRLWAEIQAAQ